MRTRAVFFGLIALSASAGAVEAVCGFCVPAKELSAEPWVDSIGIHDREPIVNITLKITPSASVVRSNHVCTGPVTQIDPKSRIFGIHHAVVLQRDRKAGRPVRPVQLTLPHVRICDGELVPLDEYRFAPFKRFIDAWTKEERKAFLDNMDKVSRQAGPEQIEAHLKKLLEAPGGPLASRKEEWVKSVKDDVVRQLESRPKTE